MISINFRDARPIYEQVRDGFRQLILSGALPADTKMPSVRELAGQLAINPNTIQRAYRELEQEGYLYSVPGKGSFAAEHREVDTQRRDALLRRFDETVRELRYLGVDAGMLRDRMEKGEDEC
jgi:GntR family transcriptional regulator